MVKQKNIPTFTILVVFGLFFVSSCGGSSGADPAKTATKDSPEKRGEEIVAEYLKRDAAPFRKIRVRFTIKTEDEPVEVYELDNWRKQTPDGTTTLSEVVKSPDNSNVASLTLEPKDQKAIVVTYAASRDEFRETGTNKMFFGGLTGGELLGEWDKFVFKFTGEKEVDGQKVFETEGNLKPGVESVASRMAALFRADNYMPVELHLFDTSGREIRAYKFSDLKDDPDHPYPARTDVDNPIYKAKIVIEILSRELPAAIDDAMFTREKLKELATK